MTHPLDARILGELGLDYLVERFRADLGIDPADPGGHPPAPTRDAESARTPQALHEALRLRLLAAARLAVEPAWRKPLQAAAAGLGAAPRDIDEAVGRWAPACAALGELVIEREGGRPYSFTQPLHSQLSLDACAVLTALALVRQATARWRGETAPMLAAPLRPRATIPPRGPTASGAMPEIVEIGDLGEPFSRLAHERVHRELSDLLGPGGRLRWRWLYCASPPFLPASHRLGAVAEAVLARAPDRFWPVVDALARPDPAAAVALARAALAAAGADPALADPPPPGMPLPEGLLRDRQVADACGLPTLRPLFAIGRRLFAGLDAAARIRACCAAGPGPEDDRPA